MMSRITLLMMICVAISVNPDADKVTFPKWPAYTFNTYSGLIDIANNQRSIHYVFVESQNNPATDPLVLWLNGGPGCSSLLGLITEIGPFVIEDGDRDFTTNPFPWNKKANLLFFESPSGVGFSKVNAEYIYTDVNSGQDNAEALRVWLNSFTAYKNRPFWITGESYAGMYIPYTAKAIVTANKDPKNTVVNIQGVMIGNGVLLMDEAFRERALVKFFLQRNFVDKVTANAINNQCQYSENSPSCQQAIARFAKSSLQSNINPYGVYGYCYEDSSPQNPNKQYRYTYTPWFSWNKYGASGAPCTDFGPLYEYFNDVNTQKALHVDQQKTTWEACNMNINQKYQRNPEGSYKILPELYTAGLSILIYSGDTDAVVSVVETEESIAQIPGIRETTPWAPFGNSDQELAGWTTEYNYLTFTVIRGAGHMVPTDKRQNGYEMFQNFIDKHTPANEQLQ